jgi:hypothetical protein
VNNTYLRGDLNALDYRRLLRFHGTHAYFAEWIAFRRGNAGRLLRHWTRPSEGFFQFRSAAGSPALAVLYNADASLGDTQLLFAINPTGADATIQLGEDMAGVGAGRWLLMADHDRFYARGAPGATVPVEPALFLPPLSCALWLREE